MSYVGIRFEWIEKLKRPFDWIEKNILFVSVVAICIIAIFGVFMYTILV